VSGRARRLFVLAACLCLAAQVQSHTLSESVSTWVVAGQKIRLEFIVPDLEAKRLSPGGAEVPLTQDIGAYLARHVRASAGTQPCSVTGPRALAARAGFSRVEFEFQCPNGQDLQIESSAFYELVPTHTNFAKIEDASGHFYEELLTSDRRSTTLSAHGAASPLQKAGLPAFIHMGIMHIFTGIDHMSFMLGLVLISRRVRDLLFVVTGFTIGHSLTLALAVTGVLRPDGQYIDSLVALTIALIGAENIGDSTHRPLPVALGLGGLLLGTAALKYLGLDVMLPFTLLIGGGIFTACYLLLTGQMRDAGRIRLWVTLVFGLIHGFGFAANLLEMRLPTDRLAPLLFGFNIGVEIGQVAVVLGALLAARLLVRLRVSMPRPLFTDLAASFLVGEGLYWFVGRTVLAG
jgi:HupE / UreJ protein